MAFGRAWRQRRARVVGRLIAVALRSHSPQTSLAVARTAAEFLDAGLAGFDFAGPEEAFPDPTPHLAAFDAARAAGLGITIHAGEWDGPSQVRSALVVNPSRIAHGAPAAADPALLEELRTRPVTLDLCPTSNVQIDQCRVARRPPAGAPGAGRRAGHAVDRRPHGLERHAGRRVRTRRTRRWGCPQPSFGRSTFMRCASRSCSTTSGCARA